MVRRQPCTIRQVQWWRHCSLRTGNDFRFKPDKRPAVKRHGGQLRGQKTGPRAGSRRPGLLTILPPISRRGRAASCGACGLCKIQHAGGLKPSAKSGPFAWPPAGSLKSRRADARVLRIRQISTLRPDIFPAWAAGPGLWAFGPAEQRGPRAVSIHGAGRLAAGFDGRMACNCQQSGLLSGRISCGMGGQRLEWRRAKARRGSPGTAASEGHRSKEDLACYECRAWNLRDFNVQAREKIVWRMGREAA